MTSQNRLINEQ